MLIRLVNQIHGIDDIQSLIAPKLGSTNFNPGLLTNLDSVLTLILVFAFAILLVIFYTIYQLIALDVNRSRRPHQGQINKFRMFSLTIWASVSKK